MKGLKKLHWKDNRGGGSVMEGVMKVDIKKLFAEKRKGKELWRGGTRKLIKNYKGHVKEGGKLRK